VTGIINGQRAITADTALRLGHWFADSDEGGQLFRLKADSASDRLRTPFR